MPIANRCDQRRRDFLKLAATGAGRLAFSAGPVYADSRTKSLRGVFPIAQTPFTESDTLDLDCLAAEVRFCQRGGVHGIVWPQIASAWTKLSEKERLDGAEAILAAAKGGRTAAVIGVQTTTFDVEGAIRLARHAARNGADAVISLPPPKAGVAELVEYYKALGRATELPLIAQTVGDISVDTVVQMSNAVPTLRAVKDEAGKPLTRVRSIREGTRDKLAVFSGNGVRTMIEEMRLGFSGHCPTTGLADRYAKVFDLWHAGRHEEAFNVFGRILAFDSIPNAEDYVLVARGVFTETTRSRGGYGMLGAEGVPKTLDEENKQFIREALAICLKD